MSKVENQPGSIRFSDTINTKLLAISKSLAFSTKDFVAGSPETGLFANSANFFNDVVNEHAVMEFLPHMKTGYAIALLSPWIDLKPVLNPDLSFAWSKAIAVDQKFRYDKPWAESRHKRKWEVNIFTSPLLTQLPIVFAEITSISKFAGSVINLSWQVIYPEMLNFAAYEESPESDWYNHPKLVLRKNWINFTDNDDLLKFMTEED